MTEGASDNNKIKIKRIVGQYIYSRQDLMSTYYRLLS